MNDTIYCGASWHIGIIRVEKRSKKDNVSKQGFFLF